MWTTEPTESGWYWWRNLTAKYEDDREPTIYKVRNYVGQLSIGNCNIQGSHFEGGEWSSTPITMPQEVKE